MFSNKENINILTALLVGHGVRKTVVCPGSRNAAIVHNLNECKGMECYPVTDERSAGFYALGMILASNEPVAVCVTSGTALLNLVPAVAEARYQHLPLIIISADRPQTWIGQQDGQTIDQPKAFGGFVKYCVSLPEPHNDEERWYCNRLVNEAMLMMKRNGCGPVHINVPVSEPLFYFSVAELPMERKITYVPSVINVEKIMREMVNDFYGSSRPMVVIGQLSYRDNTEWLLQRIEQYAVVIREPLSPFRSTVPFDEVLYKIDDDEAYMPDFILYLGGTLVSKRIKKFLRRAKEAVCWTVSEDGDMHDTFMNLGGIIEANPYDVLMVLNSALRSCGRTDDTDVMDLMENSAEAYVRLWKSKTDGAFDKLLKYQPDYSEMMAVKVFERQLDGMNYDYKVHYANSMAVRLGDIYAQNHYIYVNRGVNGIEGSLSTAAGFSVVSEDMVFCVTGDLSFFYDQNALWNQNLEPNFRILLLNNKGGSIFSQLVGIKDSPECKTMVAASHSASASGICDENNIGYLCVHNEEELRERMNVFLAAGGSRPLLMEVFTDISEDARTYEEYYREVRG
mgnify:FL=1